MDLTFQPPLPPEPDPPPRRNLGTTENWVIYQWGEREPIRMPLPQMPRINLWTTDEARNEVVARTEPLEEEVDDLAHARRKIALMQKRINELESRVARAERRRHGKK